jgi:hypothetical protein
LQIEGVSRLILYKKDYPKLSRPRVERKDYTKLFSVMEVERKDSTKLSRLPKWKQRITRNNPD